MDEIKLKNKFMKEALKEAQKAYDKNEIPVGAVIVKEKKMIRRNMLKFLQYKRLVKNWDHGDC